MKTKNLFAAIAFSIFTLCSVSLSAQHQDLIYDETLNDQGQRAAIVYYDQEGSLLTPVKKNDFTYNPNGDISEKVSYIWDSKKEDWAFSTKMVYSYHADKKLAQIAMMKWNAKKKNWERKGTQEIGNMGNSLAKN